MNRRIVALVSILLLSAAVLGYLWWGRFHYHHSLLLAGSFAVGILTLLLNHLYFGDSRKQLGLRLDNFRQAGLAYGGLTLGGVLLLTAAGGLLGSPEMPAGRSILHYFLWAGAQQYLLQNLLRLRSQDLFRMGSSPGATRLVSSLVAAGLFAGYHWPNLPLAAFTFGGGLLWCLLFAWIPSFPWAWATQGMLAMALAVFFKAGPLDQFQVGRPGFRYEYYGGGALVAGGYDARGRPVIATLPGPDRGVKARVRIFDPSGKLRAEWIAFPGLEFSGRIAVGELGYGPGDEVVVTPGPAPANPALVRIFDLEGRPVSEFPARELPSRYGAGVAVSCGRLYLSPGAGPEAPARLHEYHPDGRALRSWSYAGLPLHNGLRGTMACPEGEAGDAPSERAPLLLWGTEIAVNPSTLFVVPPGEEKPRSWPTFPTTYGLQLAPLALGTGNAGVALSPGPLIGYPPLVRLLDLQDRTFREWVAFEDEGACGGNLGAVDLDGDGTDEVILGEGVCAGRPPTVRLLAQDGTPITSWSAY